MLFLPMYAQGKLEGETITWSTTLTPNWCPYFSLHLDSKPESSLKLLVLYFSYSVRYRYQVLLILHLYLLTHTSIST